LACDDEVEVQIGEEAGAPGAAAEEDFSGLVGVEGRGDRVGPKVDMKNGLVGVEGCAGLQGEAREVGDGLFAEDEAGLGFVDGGEVVGDGEERVLVGQIGAGDGGVGEVVLAGGLERAVDDVTGGRAHVDTAGAIEDFLAGFGFELVPEFIGAAEEGDVIGVFVVGEADHAGVAVRAAQGVDEGELFEAQDADAAAGELPAGGCAHGADADDDNVEGFGHDVC